MNLESLMLRSLGVACTVVCVLVLGAMLAGTPATPGVAALASSRTAAVTCQMPPDAVVCPRPAI